MPWSEFGSTNHSATQTLLILHKNIYCGYTLSLPCQGHSNEYSQQMSSSNEYLQRMFLRWNEDNHQTPIWAMSWENPFSHMRTTNGADPHSLISTFGVCFLDCITPKLVKFKLSRLASLCCWAGQFKSYLVQTPEERFSCDMILWMFEPTLTGRLCLRSLLLGRVATFTEFAEELARLILVEPDRTVHTSVIGIAEVLPFITDCWKKK